MRSAATLTRFVRTGTGAPPSLTCVSNGKPLDPTREQAERVTALEGIRSSALHEGRNQKLAAAEGNGEIPAHSHGA
jgi:hypothetical protein